MTLTFMIPTKVVFIISTPSVNTETSCVSLATYSIRKKNLWNTAWYSIIFKLWKGTYQLANERFTKGNSFKFHLESFVKQRIVSHSIFFEASGKLLQRIRLQLHDLREETKHGARNNLMDNHAYNILRPLALNSNTISVSHTCSTFLT